MQAIKLIMLFLKNPVSWESYRKSDKEIADLVISNEHYQEMREAYISLSYFIPNDLYKTTDIMRQKNNHKFVDKDTLLKSEGMSKGEFSSFKQVVKYISGAKSKLLIELKEQFEDSTEIV